MDSPWISLVPLILLIAASALGMRVRLYLKEHHKASETADLLRVTVTMLVTFAAIVLGLLITSSKTSFETASSAVKSYAASLIQLDESLKAAGPASAAAQQNLAQYTAAMIASTWTDEAPPAGTIYPKNIPDAETGIYFESPVLSQVLRTITHQILALPNATPAQAALQRACLEDMQSLVQRRWALIAASQVSLSAPFFWVLVFWLFVVFLCLGLSTPFNALSFITILLGAISLTSALFVIIDLATLYNGYFAISSTPMRGALAQMLQH